MSTPAKLLIADHIRTNGPITFAEFMELALYHPEVGYYAGAAQRSGRAGDFYTSVDVGPIFGSLLAEQFAEMFELLDNPAPGEAGSLDLVEAGAGNGRLSRDLLDALQRQAPSVYERLRVHLVERSAPARTQQAATLGPHASRLASSSPRLEPKGGAWRGVLFANELLDALPTHVVVGARGGDLLEIYVDLDGDSLVERDGPLSTPALARYLERVGARLQPGWRAEVNLAALEWIRQAGAALDRGFIVLVDYGHDAASLYSASHAAGTLATFTSHVVEVHEEQRTPPWLRDPGASDITAHVDFTSLRAGAREGGLEVLCLVDQTQFLMAIGVERHLANRMGDDRQSVAARLALKTLLLPGGLGSTHHVLILGKGVGTPQVKGCLAKPRVERIK
jgi:SAM-dependent MidA family methyltransferase